MNNIIRRRWRWIGHVWKKINKTTLRQLFFFFFWTLAGKRHRGRLRWRDDVPLSRKWANLKLMAKRTKAGQRQAEVTNLCCYPTCHLAKLAVSNFFEFRYNFYKYYSDNLYNFVYNVSCDKTIVFSTTFTNIVLIKLYSFCTAFTSTIFL